MSYEHTPQLKGKIRENAVVTQNLKRFTWPGEMNDKETVFTVKENAVGTSRRVLIADGYGSLNEGENVGEGALYVNQDDILFLPYDEQL